MSQDTDSIPFVLQERVVASIDSVPANDFFSYQYLPLDSSKVFYNVDAIDKEIVFSGLEGLVRPFMQQFGSVLFLVFTFLFVLSALVFKRSGQELLSSFGYIFAAGSRNKKSYNDQIAVSGLWISLFCVLQTFVIYTIFFLDLAIDYTTLFIDVSSYLILFLQILVVIFLFVISKYLLYKFMGMVFSDSKINTLVKVYLLIVFFTGIISFIPIVAYIYIPEVKIYVLFFLLAVFIIGRIAVFVRSYTFFVKSHIGILYFFVYLCGIEIMPYFLLYKTIVLMN